MTSPQNDSKFYLNVAIAQLVLFFITLLALGVIAWKLNGAIGDIATAQSFTNGDCDFQRTRTTNAEIYYANRAILERSAAKRGYKTTIDWNGLADNDTTYSNYVGSFFLPGCGDAPTPPPSDGLVRPYVTMPPQYPSVPPQKRP